eukprot:COSAG05_NODE_49_length_24373_cov_16.162561_9_plen_105_part_00
MAVPRPLARPSFCISQVDYVIYIYMLISFLLYYIYYIILSAPYIIYAHQLLLVSWVCIFYLILTVLCIVVHAYIYRHTLWCPSVCVSYGSCDLSASQLFLRSTI